MDLQPNKIDGIVKPITNTRISASEWNQLVGSCMAFITAAGFTPDADDNQQFLNAFIQIAQNIGAVGANVDLSNLSATGENHFVQLQSGVAQADVDYVIESYQNGTSWYRVYKSGWCEQGGLVVNITPNQWTFVALLKEYADTNYTVIGSGVDPSVSTDTPDQFFAYRSPLQTTGFYGGFRYLTGSSAFTDRGFSWRACGYLATES